LEGYEGDLVDWTGYLENDVGEDERMVVVLEDRSVFLGEDT
jgi:hypothetical protein